MTAAPRFPGGLYGITPQTTDFSALSKQVEQAAAGGMRILQWRQKMLAQDIALSCARQIRQQCHQLGVMFIINDNVELAMAVDADGVHLGKDDGDLNQARSVVGRDKIIGCSCYNDLERAETAMRQGADYVAFGAMFPSSVKPEAVRAPLEIFSHAQRLRTSIAPDRVSLVAIGGITTTNAASVIEAGADNLAVIGGLFDSPNIRETAAQFAALF